MISPETYALDALINLHQKIKDREPKEIWGYRRIYLRVLNSYWLYAVATVRLHEECFSRSYSTRSQEEGSYRLRDFDHKSHACAIASYIYMRICLDACQKLSFSAFHSAPDSKAATTLLKYRKSNKRSSQEIIGIRNLIGAHPTQESSVIPGAAFWDSDGFISFQAFNLDDFSISHKKADLDPNKHLLWLKEYILNLLPLLERCWRI